LVPERVDARHAVRKLLEEHFDFDLQPLEGAANVLADLERVGKGREGQGAVVDARVVRF